MALRIEIPQSNKALTEFVQFYDRVYDYREARWRHRWSCSCRFLPEKVRLREDASCVRLSLMKEVGSPPAQLP